ncbi:hypothetical protein G7Z17_g4270 [Cylindrodendrum hubeiense]|uniref:F-box domain-containing protein n=1 Tax=Cylindrodendrum hubeiense TaxID=595255 RepID=A0A9P5H967_9HYPO|nr:hypothetical protein G7Z17_g4270 [Cylindrodendrum hubeiense]
MEKLPPEILSAIVWHLVESTRFIYEVLEDVPTDSLATYATISHQWQQQVEALTFRHLFLTPKIIASAEAESYLTPTRLSYLRYIQVDFFFPRDDRTRLVYEQGGDNNVNKLIRYQDCVRMEASDTLWGEFCLMASKMTRLRDVYWELSDAENWKRDHRRVQLRNNEVS